MKLKRKKLRTRKALDNKKIVLIVVLVLFISVGFSVLTTNLVIQGVATIKACPAGTYSTLLSNECKSCPTGYTSDKNSFAQSSCYIKTTAGKYIATANSSTQTTCEAGYKCPSSTINYGKTGSKTQCSAGTYAPAGSSTCSSCPSGYTSAAGAGANTSCYVSVSAGKYKTTATGSTQASCPAGTYKAAHNSYYNSSDSCTICPAGYYCPAGASSATKCASGLTSSAGSSSCSEKNPPVITASYNTQTGYVNFTFTDESGIAGYAFTTSSTAPSNYTTYTSTTLSRHIESAGTYYIYVKDKYGNVASKKIVSTEKVHQTNLNATGYTNRNDTGNQYFTYCAFEFGRGEDELCEASYPRTVSTIYALYGDNDVIMAGTLTYTFSNTIKREVFLKISYTDTNSDEDGDYNNEFYLSYMVNGSKKCGAYTESGTGTFRCSLGSTTASSLALKFDMQGDVNNNQEVYLRDFRFVYYDVVIS